MDKKLTAVCRKLGIRVGHPRHIAALGGRIFDRARHVHGLTKTVRPLLEPVAVLQHVAAEADPPNRPHILDETLDALDLSDVQKRICRRAAEISPPRQDISALVRSLSIEPDDTEQQMAARLAAILRLSTGLDHSRSQKTSLEAVHDTGREIRLIVSGDDATAEDVASAQSRGNLWNELLSRPVQILQARQPVSRYAPVLQGDESIVKSVRRVLQQQVEQLMSREYGACFDEDPEFVHEMRVAARRIRTALRVSRDALGPQGDYWADEFAWLADALGAVRDIDVFLDYLDNYRRDAPKTHAAALEKLRRSEQRGRSTAAGKLRDALESPRYEKLRSGFGRAVRNPIGSLEGLQAVGDRAEAPVRVEAGRILGERLDALAAYGRDLDRLEEDRLHKLRITCKRLRYVAEFFADVYPDGLDALIKPMTRMQDLLGFVHDTQVWSDRLATHAKRRAADKAFARMRKALLRRLDQQREQALGRAARKWKTLTAPSAMDRLRAEVVSLEGARPE